MIIEIIFAIISIYLVCGFVFSIIFSTTGINKVDEVAKGSTIGFRIIIIPGVIIFWVFLLRKWMHVPKTGRND